jgi:hypothetical protein
VNEVHDSAKWMPGCKHAESMFPKGIITQECIKLLTDIAGKIDNEKSQN